MIHTGLIFDRHQTGVNIRKVCQIFQENPMDV
jgi:hypothetical protein